LRVGSFFPLAADFVSGPGFVPSPYPEDPGLKRGVLVLN